MIDDRTPERVIPLRSPCKSCGCQDGRVRVVNGQNTVRCLRCDAYAGFNVPKHELGEAPKPVRSDSVKPKTRYAIAERANYRCEFCGADAQTRQMHVGHLLSEKEIRDNNLPLEWADHPDNLVWICAECNLGMGSRSFMLHHALLWIIRRQL